ncbi:MAG: cytochrome b/b6 domain-containing protein [Nitrosomonadales bacterium]|nr:cytochrome b/b6 domain-containing protein [Nitrosomonadales bacterium]
MSRFLNSEESYGIIAQVLHWGVAALIFVQLPLGLYAANLPVSLARLRWLSYHKSLGLTILVLVLLRLVWRWIDAPPPLPGTLARRERCAARAMHRALYLVPVLATLAGWLYASAAGLSVNWFGVLLIPDLIAKNTELAPLFKVLHHVLVGLLALLLIGHIGAAARHALVLRDNVMQRILPAGWLEKK